MRYVVVRDDLIENVTEWDGISAWAPPAGTTAHQSDSGDIGWLWNNGDPINPNPPPPIEESPVNGLRGLKRRRVAALEQGDIYSQIEALKLRIEMLGG